MGIENRIKNFVDTYADKTAAEKRVNEIEQNLRSKNKKELLKIAAEQIALGECTMAYLEAFSSMHSRQETIISGICAILERVATDQPISAEMLFALKEVQKEHTDSINKQSNG